MEVDLRGCIEGRKDAWDAFVRQSARIIYAAVNRAMRGRTQHTADVDDRVQEVYVRLLRENCRLLRTFDPARASLPTWLSLISRTIVHEHHQRKQQPITGVEAADIRAAPVPIDRSPEVSLDILSPQQKAVIQMLFEQDMSVEQAAARLGVEAQTIRSAKHKALIKLREVMVLKPPPSGAENPASLLEKPRFEPRAGPA